MEKTMEKIVALSNARGFIHPGSQIYGGLAIPGITASSAWS